MTATLKQLTYLNLLTGIVLLFAYLNSPQFSYDYFYLTGILITIWHNWETIRQLNGQYWKVTVIFIVRLLTILFGLLLLISGASIIIVLEEQKGFIFFGIFRVLWSLTIIFQAFLSWKLKLHRD